jgi:hypothetical protein
VFTQNVEFFIIFFLSIIIIYLLIVQNSYEIFAVISPPFVRQEIIDDNNDWELWNGKSDSTIIIMHNGKKIDIKKAQIITECQIFDDYLIPDIESISYSSDGKRLNATMWLTSPFTSPLSNDTLDIYQEDFKIKISKTNGTLQDHIIEKKAQIFDPTISILNENDNISLTNNTAYKVTYTIKRGDNIYTILDILTIINKKLYEFSFTALNSSFQIYNSTVQDMLNSFKIYDNYENQFANSSVNKIKNMVFYSGNGILIYYPIDWNIKERYSEKYDQYEIIFQTPFEDTKKEEPSWQETTFTMALDISSVHDSGTDYRLLLKRNITNLNQFTWEKEFQEISAFNKYNLLEEYPYKDIIASDQIPFSLDLKSINFPETYKLIFFITNYYIYNHQLCRLIDTTNWVLIPPPEFNTSFTPPSAELRPGDEENIEVKINGNSNVESHISFDIDHKYDEMIDTKFVSQKTTVPRNGEGTSTLKIEIPENLTVQDTIPLSLPIYTNISFPNLISNRGGDIFYNNKTISLNDSATISVSVLPPYTWEEKLNNFTSSYITPLSVLWTFIIGVATVTVPLIVKLYRRKENRLNNEKKRGEKEKEKK